MKFGLGWHRRSEAKSLAVPASRLQAKKGAWTGVTRSGRMEPDRRLSPDALDEPAEVLVRIAPEALEDDKDLGGGADALFEEQAQPEQPAEAAEAEVAAVAAPEPEEPAEIAEAEVAQPEQPAEAAEAEVAAVAAPEPEEPAEIAEAEVAEPEQPAEVASEAVADAAGIDRGAAPNVSGEAGEQSTAFAEEDLPLADAFVPTIELEAQAEPYRPVAPPPADDLSLQIRLARIHLKTGSLTTARAELETLASRDGLDTAALLDLAEVRWRTGDLAGAGDAAIAYLADGGTGALGFVIAAEAAAMANRQADARRHTEEALARDLSDLDPVFAGMTRRAMWPPSVWSVAATAGSADAPAAAAEVAPGAPAGALAETAEWVGELPEAAPVSALDSGTTTTNTVGGPRNGVELAGADAGNNLNEPIAGSSAITAESPFAQAPVADGTKNVVEAGSEVAAGRSRLEANDAIIAALHFGVAIRLAPELAGDVLVAIGERQDLPLQLVRGDALRLLGLESDAGKAYVSLANALGSSVSAESEAAPGVAAEPGLTAEPAEGPPPSPGPAGGEGDRS